MEAIVSSDNDYLIKVKANQPKLYQQIETQSLTQIPVQKYVEHERTRDRDSNRIVEVYEVPENIDPLWIGAGCVIKVERNGTRGSEPLGKILSNLPALAKSGVDCFCVTKLLVLQAPLVASSTNKLSLEMYN